MAKFYILTPTQKGDNAMKAHAFFIVIAATALTATGCTTPTGGSSTAGADAGRDTATKAGDGITGRHWKLVELNGRPVPALQREPYLILNTEGARVNGFGGCNGFSGSYEIDQATSRIRFGQIASTMMACPAGMDIENAFHEVLSSADNYSLSGDHLTLNRARMAPLARFEAVHAR